MRTDESMVDRQSRRAWLEQMGGGFGSVVLSSLLADTLQAECTSRRIRDSNQARNGTGCQL